MNIKRIKITRHDAGWKGTWYKTGERHLVVERRAAYLAEAYHAVRLCGGINNADCVELTDLVSRLLCIVERVRILIGIQNNHADAYC